MSSCSLSFSLSRSISTLARRHSLSSSMGSTAAILDCSVVVPRSLRSPLFPRTVHEIVARRVERRHDELKNKRVMAQRHDEMTRRLNEITWQDDELTRWIGEMRRWRDEMKILSRSWRHMLVSRLMPNSHIFNVQVKFLWVWKGQISNFQIIFLLKWNARNSKHYNTLVKLSRINVFPQATSTEKNGGVVGCSWDKTTEALSWTETEKMIIL